MTTTDAVIIGQGLAGSCLAWSLHWAGRRVQVIDRNEATTASGIAAGLMTPVTGRRMSADPNFRSLKESATTFYRRVEQQSDSDLLEARPSVRLFRDESERSDYAKKREELRDICQDIQDTNGQLTGFLMQHAARLNVRRFLTETRAFFTKRGEYHASELNLNEEVEITESEVRIRSHNITSPVIVLCQGYQRDKDQWFKTFPDGPVKGEILRVRLPGYHEERVVHKGIWIVPEAEGNQNTTFLAGATYDRHNLNNEPTAGGREELLRGLKEITDAPPEVIGHMAAIRAGMKRRKPVIGQHPKFKRVFILNGLGSRGALLAPIAAQALTDLLLGRPIDLKLREIIDILPQAPETEHGGAKSRKQKSLTLLAHSVIGRIVQPGDTVIDATAGNGYDTVKLAKLVGAGGHTIGIDIQPEAIRQTAARLGDGGLTADLRVSDHAEELSLLDTDGIRAKAVMFNLGYLPGSDKSVLTSVHSTLLALRAASRLLVPGGAITIVAYRGHSGGEEEAAGVARWITALPADQFETSNIDGDPDNPTSPVLFIVRRSR